MGFDPVVQWLANRGYVVLQVNFRGSSGYGKAHLQAGDREWGGRMLADLVDARGWAIREGYADPGKLCVMGGSYGGYASLIALAFAPEMFACGVSVAGISHLPAQVRSRTSGTPVRWHWERRVGLVVPDDASLRARSPLHHVRSVRSPLLMAHGANDVTVGRVQSDVMVAALRKNEKPVMYLVLPGDGHAFQRAESRLRFFALAELFLAQVLGGRVEPPSPREDWEPFLR